MTARSVDVYSASQNRLRAASFQDQEEKECAEYAERHNLHALFAEFACQLREKDPKTEQEAERVLLDLLSQRKAERDRAALRLHFESSFEVNLDNGRRVLKMTTSDESATLHVAHRSRSMVMDETFPITVEQVEELTEVFYELGRFVVENPKGDQGGYISIDDRDVYLLSAGKECSEVGDHLFNMGVLMKAEK